jgi:hypothetical protein
MNDSVKSDSSRRIVLLALVAAVLGGYLARERSDQREQGPVGNASSRSAVVPAVTALRQIAEQLKHLVATPVG